MNENDEVSALHYYQKETDDPSAAILVVANHIAILEETLDIHLREIHDTLKAIRTTLEN